MTNLKNLDPLIAEAIAKIEGFIFQTTGQVPTPGELSSALTRYFVLKEILDFVKMSREENQRA